MSFWIEWSEKEMYRVEFSKDAMLHVDKLKKSQPAALKKLYGLLKELEEHPRTGTGKPEKLKNSGEIWSRRLDQKNRLKYEIDDEIVTVLVFSAIGHYTDK